MNVRWLQKQWIMAPRLLIELLRRSYHVFSSRSNCYLHSLFKTGWARGTSKLLFGLLYSRSETADFIISTMFTSMQIKPPASVSKPKLFDRVVHLEAQEWSWGYLSGVQALLVWLQKLICSLSFACGSCAWLLLSCNRSLLENVARSLILRAFLDPFNICQIFTCHLFLCVRVLENHSNSKSKMAQWDRALFMKKKGILPMN